MRGPRIVGAAADTPIRVADEKGRTMPGQQSPHHEPATRPEELGRLFLQRARAGDVDGVVALYEPGAVLARPGGEQVVGSVAIRAFYERFLAGRPRLESAVRAPVRNGELAITSTTRRGNATVEVARRQPDGAWLWAIDQPNVVDPA